MALTFPELERLADPLSTTELRIMVEEGSLECDFETPPRPYTKCKQLAVCRVRLTCMPCDRSRILWACSNHLEQTKLGMIFCAICEKTSISWEVVS